MANARWMVFTVALLAAVAVVADGVGLAGVEDAPALEDENAKRSYALGMALGNQLRSQEVEIDVELYRRGLRDALSGGETLLTEEEVRAAVRRLQVEVNQKKRAPQREKLGAAAPAGRMQVSFKLDPRVTKSLYMGERWVSGATYSSTPAPKGEAITIEARARRTGTGGAGKERPRWIASDPEMVTLSNGEGEDVKLTVRRAGESIVTVSQGELSSAFTVKTVHQADQWRVELSRLERPPAPHGVTAAAAPSAADREGE